MHMREIRRIASIIAILLVIAFGATAYAAPADYDASQPSVLSADYLYGESAVVIDGDTGGILFTKDARIRMYPASTTKIMTLLLAVESGWSFDLPVTIPAEASNIPGDSSIVPIYPGETTTFGDLLYGMMLHSGNDAANAVAVLVAGSIPAFVERMNARAEELGCSGTHFVNAHGYHDENHYSTAQDLALITREALKYDSIRQIVSTPTYTMTVYPRGEIVLHTTNSMIVSTSGYYYEDCIGVKTGTHSRAGRCFVGAAEKDGVRLISVTLNCSSDDEKWTDTKRLFNFGFTCYTPYTLEQMFELTSSRIVTTRVSNASEDDPMGGVLQLKIAQVSNPDYERMIQTGNDDAKEAALVDFVSRAQITLMDNLTAPITEGEFVGTFSYTAQDGEVINASLIAGRSIEAQPEKTTVYDVFPFLRIFENPLVRMLIVVLLLLIAVIAIYANVRRRRRERRRRQIYEQRRREYLRKQRAAEASGRRTTASNSRSRASDRRRPSEKRRTSARRSDEDDIFGGF